MCLAATQNMAHGAWLTGWPALGTLPARRLPSAGVVVRRFSSCCRLRCIVEVLTQHQSRIIREDLKFPSLRQVPGRGRGMLPSSLATAAVPRPTCVLVTCCSRFSPPLSEGLSSTVSLFLTRGGGPPCTQVPLWSNSISHIPCPARIAIAESNLRASPIQSSSHTVGPWTRDVLR